MKRLAFTTIIILSLTVSCAPTTTPQPLVIFATATALIPTSTATPALTETPTLMPTSTLTTTPSLTPRPTETNIPSPTATDAATRGKVIFSAEWNGKLGSGWAPAWPGDTYVRAENVTYEFVLDPLDSSRQVIKYTVTGPSLPITRWGNQYWQNSYAAWANSANKPVSAIEVKFFFPPDFEKDIGLLSAHGTKGGNDVTGIQMGSNKRVYAYVKDAEGAGLSNRTDAVLDPNKWYTLRIEYRNDKTYFLVNGKIVFIADFKFQAIDAHAGWQYANTDPNIFHKTGEWILQKDFLVETPK